MKLRSENNLSGDEGRSAETGPASEIPTDPFEEGEQTLNRPDYHHHADLEEPDEDFERRKFKERRRSRSVPRLKRENNFCSRERPNRRLRATCGERNNPL